MCCFRTRDYDFLVVRVETSARLSQIAGTSTEAIVTLIIRNIRELLFVVVVATNGHVQRLGDAILSSRVKAKSAKITTLLVVASISRQASGHLRS